MSFLAAPPRAWLILVLQLPLQDRGSIDLPVFLYTCYSEYVLPAAGTFGPYFLLLHSEAGPLPGF